ncbi:hypothetical protein SWG_02207 [Staphylococcus aureus M0035]|nr:hypothetical protein SWG_02207 [Staphylococcus aureus M0035]ENM42920.1 hypothetical protein U71_02285 [Staphylococcus aureus M1188]EWQ22042.1 hypothetical protein Q183_00965 [Staphylococcus aureus M1181]
MDFTGVITSIIDLIKTCIQAFGKFFQLKNRGNIQRLDCFLCFLCIVVNTTILFFIQYISQFFYFIL